MFVGSIRPVFPQISIINERHDQIDPGKQSAGLRETSGLGVYQTASIGEKTAQRQLISCVKYKRTVEYEKHKKRHYVLISAFPP